MINGSTTENGVLRGNPPRVVLRCLALILHGRITLPFGTPAGYTIDMELTLEQRAAMLAIEAHGDQKYGELPYVWHLQAVVRNIDLAYGLQPAPEYLLAAAWLHDAIEDTELTLRQIDAAVGPRVLALVGSVTDRPGRNRRERKARTLPAIRASGCDAVLLKVADRLANMSNANDSLREMYLKEYRDFRKTLYDGQDLQPVRILWTRLDNHYPRVYHRLIRDPYAGHKNKTACGKSSQRMKWPWDTIALGGREPNCEKCALAS